VAFALTFPWNNLAASVATGQNKMSGTMRCAGKPTESHALEVGDHPGHVYMITKGGGCTWTKPPEIAGTKMEDQTGVFFYELDTNRVTYHGSDIMSMENGDKIYANLCNRGTPEKGINAGIWNSNGGTGKFQGIKGTGTYRCTFEGKPSMESPENCELQGEYSLPSK
jgi:hypothetical protein